MRRVTTRGKVVFAMIAAAIGCQSTPQARPPGQRPAPATAPPSAVPQPEILERKRREVPISLTVADAELALRSVHAEAVVQDPLALTELRLTFDNPDGDQLDAQLRVRLPPRASVIHLAVGQGDGWEDQPLGPAPRARHGAGVIEEGFVAPVKRSPGEPQIRLLVAYVEELSPDDPYAIAVAGLGRLDELSVQIDLPSQGAPPARLRLTNYVPVGDVGLRRGRLGAGSGLRADDRAVARVVPVTSNATDPLDSVLVLFDSSASRAAGFDDQLAVLERLARALATRGGASVKLEVAAYDQTVRVVFEGAARQFGERQTGELAARGAFGASDLLAALDWAAPAAKQRGHQRLVVVTDSQPSAFTPQRADLPRALTALRDAGVVRVDVLAVGASRDDTLLEGLVSADLPERGRVIHAPGNAESLGKQLHARMHAVQLEVPGAGWFWPRELPRMYDGEGVVVYAELEPDRALRVLANGRPLREPTLAPAGLRLLTSAWTHAEAASRAHRAAPASNPTPPRPASAVALDGPPPRCPREQRRRGEESGGTEFDSIGTVSDLGSGWVGGIGSARPGSLRLDTTRPRPRATVRFSAPEVQGELYAPVVNRILRQNYGRFRMCYEQGLDREPKLRGRMRVKFVVDASGSLTNLADAGSELPDQGVVACVIRGHAGLSFPRPKTGIVTVVSTMAFYPPGDPAARRRAPASPPPQSQASPGAVSPHHGEVAGIMALLDGDQAGEALQRARAWRERAPGDARALLVLGQAYQQLGRTDQAMRAFGSLLDLYPHEPTLLRLASGRLLALHESDAAELAARGYRRAIELKGDLNAHRGLAFAQLALGRPEAAFDALAALVCHDSDRDRETLQRDLGQIAAAWRQAQPGESGKIAQRLRDVDAQLETHPSLRLVLIWEGSARDLDLHVYDGRGGHVWYSHRQLAGLGEFFVDREGSSGTEEFLVAKGRRARASTLVPWARYFADQPHNFAAGRLQVIAHNGRGRVEVTERPFLVTQDAAYVPLGEVAQ